MDKLDSLASAFAALSAVLAAVTPNEEVRLLAFSALGAVAGGYVGASIGTDATTGEASRRTSLAKRWAVNFAAGLFVGPVATEWLTEKLPDFSPLYLAIFSGGACGVLAVSVICLLMPWILSQIKSRTSKLP